MIASSVAPQDTYTDISTTERYLHSDDRDLDAASERTLQSLLYDDTLLHIRRGLWFNMYREPVGNPPHIRGATHNPVVGAAAQRVQMRQPLRKGAIMQT